VVLGLSVGPAVALGLSRFAYALLLPSMRLNLHWSFATAGALNTANALGYLVGALLTTPSVRRWGVRRSFISGLIVSVLVLIMTGSSGNILILMALRSLSGIAGAVTFITGAGLVAMVVSDKDPRQIASRLGIYFSGAGAGIVASGIGIPYLLSVTNLADGWRYGWIFLAGLGILALIVGIPVALACDEPPAQPLASRGWPARHFSRILMSYTLFGAGYIAYMTFIVAFIKGHGIKSGEITAFWVVLGCASMAGAVIWARPIARMRGGRGPAVVLAAVSAGALLPLVSHSTGAAIGSAVLFGGSFLSVVTSVTLVVRRSVEPYHWTAAIAGLTIAFALGQSIGPLLAGVLSDGPAGLSLGLDLSVGVLVAATLISLTQRHYETPNLWVSANTNTPKGHR